MPRVDQRLFVGIYNSVLALDPRDGAELWRVKLGGMSLVNVFYDGEQLFATTKGEVFCLDPKTGAIVWQNKLKGLGTGLVTFASTRAAGAVGQQQVTTASAAAAARQAQSSAS